MLILKTFIEVTEILLSFGENILSSNLLSKNMKVKIYRILILSVVCGCEIWCLTLRQERRLWVFESRVFWKIFGPKRDEVTGEWRKLPIEELSELRFSPSVKVIKSVRMLI